MKQWFRKIGYKIAGWMYGRYGNDELSYVLLFTAIACLLISYLPIPFFFLFSILSYAAIFFSVFRTLSKNLPKRKRELERYLCIKNKPKNAWQLHKNKKRDKDTHCYFKCKKCRAVLRVPKGKGSIIVTCPRCGERIERIT